MNTPKRIFKNSTYVLAGNVFSGLVIFFLNAYIARYLGASLFGDFSLIFAFISFFAGFASMGIDNILIREMARNPEKETQLVNNALSLKIIFSVAAIVLVGIIIMFMPYSMPVKLGVMIYSASLL